MRYSTKPKYRKYVEDYSFLSLAKFCRNLEKNMAKKLMDTATKAGIDAAKTTSKRGVQKTAETTEYLTGNKIADKIT